MIMSKNFKYFCFTACYIATMWSVWDYMTEQKDNEPPPTIINEQTQVETNENDVNNDWNAFIQAIIWVESKGDCNAVGSKNDVGVMQITPILLNDANRILGENKYSMEDRKDSLKSVEIFNVIQNHYNPQHDYHWALKIWNSRAPQSYHRKVMDKFNDIKRL